MNTSFLVAITLILSFVTRLSFGQLTSSDQQLIVTQHNTDRSYIANGHISGYKTAAKMYPLKWSKTLASYAQKLADTCDFNPNTYGKGYGQLLGFDPGADSKSKISDVITARIVDWWDHSKDWFLSPFYQMASDLSTEIGCGYKICPNMRGLGGAYVVCNYDQIYKLNQNGLPHVDGTTGSKCPKGADTLGLCL